MAKELPYFKFEPGEWDTGKIQIVSFELQGIFINLCSFYWQRLGNLPYKLALQKICGGNATALQNLCNEKIITINDDFIIIKFLDEQLKEFENISKINSKNAHKGWKKRRKNNNMRPHSERNAIREDKNIINIKDNYNKELFINIKEEDITEVNKNYYKIAKSFFDLFEKNLTQYGSSTTNLYKAKGTWINDARLMIEKDKISLDQLRIVFDFISKDNFWKANILSLSKLREQMPTLLLKANGTKQQKSDKGATQEELTEITKRTIEKLNKSQ